MGGKICINDITPLMVLLKNQGAHTKLISNPTIKSLENILVSILLTVLMAHHIFVLRVSDSQ
jgi:hypothetical protein